MLKCVVGWDDLSVVRFNQTHDQCKVWANLFPHSIQGEHSAARCVVLSLPGICHIISRNWVWIWALTVNLCCDQTWLLIRSRRVIDNFRQMNSEDSPRWVTTAKKSHLSHHSVFVKPHDFCWAEVVYAHWHWREDWRREGADRFYPILSMLASLSVIMSGGHYGNLFPVLQSGSHYHLSSDSPGYWRLQEGHYHRNRPHELWTGGKSRN